jgi:hypothetical protein
MHSRQKAMHARVALLALSLFAALPGSAITLEELRRSLSEYTGETPLKVKIEATLRRGEGDKKREGAGVAIADDDGTTLRMVHDKKELSRHLTEKKNKRLEADVNAGDAMELMNYGPPLLRILEGATLKKTSATTLDGNAATLLEIVPLREKDEDGDKWIKGYSDTLLLWISANGVPVAAERTLKIKARIVVVGVEFNKKEKHRFVRVGDRLLAGARSVENASSGLGKSETEFRTAKVLVVR